MGFSTCLPLAKTRCGYFTAAAITSVKSYWAMRFPARLPMRSATASRRNSCSFTPVGGDVGSPIYHAQGAGKDDVKPELRKFLSLLDEGLKKYLGHTGAPLVLAGVD